MIGSQEFFEIGDRIYELVPCNIDYRTGLSIAHGSWIMFVDSDDWVHEDFCLNVMVIYTGRF